MKKKINEELDHDLNIQNVSPIIQVVADNDRFQNGSPE
jgi:hypothetical protein